MGKLLGTICFLIACCLALGASAQTTSFFGVHDVFPSGRPDARVTGFLIRPGNPGFFIAGMGQPWTGQGQVNGQSGFYDWKFSDGRSGRTDFRINPDGSLQGHVVGPGIDSEFIARHAGFEGGAMPMQPASRAQPIPAVPTLGNITGPIWHCPDGDQVIIDAAGKAVEMIMQKPPCRMVIVDGIVGKMQNDGCPFLIGIYKVRQSVSVQGKTVTWSFRDAGNGLLTALNSGTGGNWWTLDTASRILKSGMGDEERCHR